MARGGGTQSCGRIPPFSDYLRQFSRATQMRCSFCLAEKTTIIKQPPLLCAVWGARHLRVFDCTTKRQRLLCGPNDRPDSKGAALCEFALRALRVGLGEHREPGSREIPVREFTCDRIPQFSDYFRHFKRQRICAAFCFGRRRQVQLPRPRCSA